MEIGDLPQISLEKVIFESSMETAARKSFY